MSTPAAGNRAGSGLFGLGAFLLLVALWDGYVLVALSQTLPELRATFGLSVSEGGKLVACANVGTIFGYFVLRLSDSVGRRPVLLWSVLGYSLTSLASALAPSVLWFLIGQFGTRIFIVSALASALLYVTEEYPTRHRRQAVALLLSAASLGGVLCAVLAPSFVAMEQGWRKVYLFGALALIGLPYGLFCVRETRSFRALSERVTPSLTSIWKGGHGPMLLVCASLWILTYSVNQSAVTFWKEHALTDLAIEPKLTGQYIALAAIVAIPLSATVGPILNQLGRLGASVLVYVVLTLGLLGSYTLPPGTLMALSLMMMFGGASGALVIVSTITTESFPTEQRGDAMGWSNSLLGRFGFVLSPLLVSTLSEQQGWSSVMPYLAVLPMLTLLIVWRFVPRADKLPVRGSSDDSARPVSAEPTAPAGQAAMAEPEAD